MLLTILAYSSALGRGFVWDDEHHVTRNDTLRDARGLGRMWTVVGATPQYYPMTHTSFWLEYHAWGLRPIGYHLDNVLLHAANAVLVGLILCRLGVRGAWLAAAVFAVHPVHVESVAWVTERKNVLSGFFYLLAARAYLRFAGVGETTPRARWRFYAASLALFACAVLSKTVAGTLPAALALVLWWKEKLNRRHVALLLPMLLFAFRMGRLTAWIEVHLVGASGPAFAFSPTDRCLIAGRAIWFYAWKLAWPSSQIFVYPRWHVDAHAAWQYAFPIGFVAVVVALATLRKRLGRAPLVAVLFFAGSLFPALGFANVFPMLFSFVADHFQYLASIALIALFAAGATGVAPAHRPWVPAAVLLPVLALLTWSQCWAYDDYETLYRDTIAKNPAAWMAHNNLGVLLEMAGRTDEAIEEYARTAELAPTDVGSRVNLGKLLVDKGRAGEAIPYLRAASRLDPADAGVQLQLGRALEAAGGRAVSDSRSRSRARLTRTVRARLARTRPSAESRGRRSGTSAARGRCPCVQERRGRRAVHVGAALPQLMINAAVVVPVLRTVVVNVDRAHAALDEAAGKQATVAEWVVPSRCLGAGPAGSRCVRPVRRRYRS